MLGQKGLWNGIRQRRQHLSCYHSPSAARQSSRKKRRGSMSKAGLWNSLLSAALCVFAASFPARAADTIEYGSVGGPSAALWPLLIGSAKGMFAAEGLAVDLVFAPSSAAVQQQLA